MVSRRDALRIGVLASALAGLSACSPAARVMLNEQRPEQFDAPPADPRILRLMHRAGYGPRPGDLDHAHRLGFEAYLEEQLHPEAIDDQPADLLVRNLHLYHKSFGQLQFHDHEDVEEELVVASIMRAVTSRRQLYEAVVAFWSDHFTVYAKKNRQLGRLKLVEDRDVIRPNALGTFPALLMASATSPAMLIFLDNHTNYAEAPNENYARELMELHTLGIDGGYTQRDVQELARALTGWTVHEDGLNAGAFTFNEAVHDATEKTVIGHTIPAGSGEAGIREMLDILATHPETARFISYKLVRRFVADNPPADLVEQLAATFLRTGGDIKTILREMFLSEAFATAPDKLKQPMSYVASMLRGLSADVGPQGFRQLYTILDRMGHLPFGWPMPDGYPDVTGAWLGTLLPRWNLALAALNGEIEGINVPTQQFIGMSGGTDNVPATLDAVAVQLLGTTLPSQTRSALLRYLAEGPGGQLKRVQQTMALILAGPAFQWM